jgi:hypothetical protein
MNSFCWYPCLQIFASMHASVYNFFVAMHLPVKAKFCTRTQHKLYSAYLYRRHSQFSFQVSICMAYMRLILYNKRVSIAYTGCTNKRRNFGVLSCIIDYVYPFTYFIFRIFPPLRIACKAMITSVLKLFSFGIQIEVPWVNMAQRMCKHQVLINVYLQFHIEIEWLKHFTTLEACKLDSQWYTFPKWATNIWANVSNWNGTFN